MLLFKRFSKYFLDLFYPPFCSHCGRIGEWACFDSLKTVEHIGHNPVILDSIEEVFSCYEYSHAVIKMLTAEYKHQALTGFETLRSKLILQSFEQSGVPKWLIHAKALIPIPSPRERIEEREIHHTYRLAEQISLLLPFKPRITTDLQRLEQRHTNAGLTKEERTLNVEHSFHWVGGTVPEELILVDDVITTGATMIEAATYLRSLGAKRIYAMSFAYTKREH